MTGPTVVAVAPNGARRTRADHPALPITPAELAREAAACHERGATLLHLHVRDAGGAHTLDPEAYRDAIAAVRREAGPGLIVQMTTEAVGRFTPAEQMAAVRAVRPEAVSLAIRELVPDAAAEPAAAAFLAECAAAGTMLQLIVYTPEDVARYHALAARGVVPASPVSVLLVLGRYTPGQVSSPADLDPLLAAYRGPAPWFVCAFGRDELACALAAAARGGHARIGFENNLHLADGRVAPDNAALVEQLAGALWAAGGRPATAAEARALLAR